jgi:two-component system NarL family sensor kinase
MQKDRHTIALFVIGTTLFILVLIAFIVFILFLYQRRHISYKQGLEDIRSSFDKAMLSAQLEIQEQTFQNISREIHDNIGLSLTLAKLLLNTIDWNVMTQTSEQVKNSIQLITKAIEDLSSITKLMHTDFIKENGLWQAIDLEIKRIEKLKIFKIQYEVNGTPIFMDNQKELVIFRILQEAFNNTIRHAHATDIRVVIHCGQNHIHIEVADNGCGFDPKHRNANKPSGTGLLNISTRATLINGTSHISSQPGKGTTITLKIPY